MINFYNFLGIRTDATNDEINKAYRDKAKEFHPDKHNGSKPADEMFKLIGQVKETLLDPMKRLEHDYANGIKMRPTPPPKIIVKEVEKEGNAVGQAVTWGLVGVFLGALFFGGDSKK